VSKLLGVKFDKKNIYFVVM